MNEACCSKTRGKIQTGGVNTANCMRCVSQKSRRDLRPLLRLHSSEEVLLATLSREIARLRSNFCES
jgi:hypothetical protein